MRSKERGSGVGGECVEAKCAVICDSHCRGVGRGYLGLRGRKRGCRELGPALRSGMAEPI